MRLRTRIGAVAACLLLGWAAWLPATAAAPQAGSVQGRIPNAAGMAVPECRVVARDAATGDVFVSAPSDRDGWYVLPVPAGGRYVLVALVAPTGGRFALPESPALAVERGAVSRDLEVPFDPPPRRAAKGTGGVDRMFLAFAEDPAMAERLHLESGVAFAELDAADRYESRLTAAFQLGALPRVELGLRAALAGVAVDRGRDVSGMRDAEGWVKFHLFRSVDQKVDVAVGALVTFPTGDERDGIGADAMQSKLFVGTTYALRSAVLLAHGGVRTTEDGVVAGVPLGGRVSFSAGAGVLVPFSDRFSFVVEADYESKRFDETEADSSVLFGMNWRVLPTATLRFALAAGLEDASPDTQALAGFALRF